MRAPAHDPACHHHLDQISSLRILKSRNQRHYLAGICCLHRRHPRLADSPCEILDRVSFPFPCRVVSVCGEGNACAARASRPRTRLMASSVRKPNFLGPAKIGALSRPPQASARPLSPKVDVGPIDKGMATRGNTSQVLTALPPCAPAKQGGGRGGMRG